jgi:hypothetical protein
VESFTLVAERQNCCSHRALTDDAVCEPLDNLFDCTDFDAMEDIDASIFEQEATSNFRSVGWVMDQLSEKVSINLIAQEIMTSSSLLSKSFKGVLVRGFDKHHSVSNSEVANLILKYGKYARR